MLGSPHGHRWLVPRAATATNCRPALSAFYAKEMNGEVDRVQVLVNYPPKHTFSSLVNSPKDVSSRLLRLERPDMERRYSKDALDPV